MTLSATFAGLLVLAVGILIGIVLGALGCSSSHRDVDHRAARLRTALIRIARDEHPDPVAAAIEALAADREAAR